MYINKIVYQVKDSYSQMNIDLNLNNISGNDNVYSVIVGENGVGKTTIFEAILTFYVPNVFKKEFLDTCYIEHYDSSKQKSQNESFKKIIISTYAAYDKLQDKKNGQFITDKNIKVCFAGNNFFNLKSLASTAYLQTILQGQTSAIEELARIIKFNSEKIYLHIETLPAMPKENIVKYIKALGKDNKDSIREYMYKREQMIFYKDKEKNIEDIINNEKDTKILNRFLEDKLFIEIYALIIEIKKILIYGKRANSLSGYGTQYLELNALITTYKRYYNIIKPYSIEELIDIDIKILENLGIYYVNNLVLNTKKYSLTLNDLSSGEFSLFTRIMEITSHITEETLVLIDEPETHLNPKWIYEYMFLLRKLYKGKRCQFIITSQSPFVVGAAQNQEVIILKRRDNQITQSKPSIQTFGGLYNFILEDVFRLDLLDNKMLDEKVKEIKEVFEKNGLQAIELLSDLGESQVKNKLIDELLTERNMQIIEQQIDSKK